MIPGRAAGSPHTDQGTLKPQELVNRVYDHVETGAVDKAVIASLRLARCLGDVLNSVMFLRELYPDLDQLRRATFEQTRHLREEARKYVWETTQDRWLEERTLDYTLSPTDEDRNVLAMGVGEMIQEVEQMERAIGDFDGPSGLSPYDAAAFSDRSIDLKGQASVVAQKYCS